MAIIKPNMNEHPKVTITKVTPKKEKKLKKIPLVLAEEGKRVYHVSKREKIISGK